MAMTRLTYQLLKEHRHILPRGGSLLEIGEANWYGDAPASMQVVYDGRLSEAGQEAWQERR